MAKTTLPRSEMKTEKDLKPLIDTDILRYRCGFAADSQIRKELIEKNAGMSPEELALAMEQLDYTALALHNVKSVMENIVDRFNPEYKAYVQGSGNFRDKLATLKPYKGNRDTAHKPKYYKEIKDYLIERWNAIEVHKQESDDAIGIEQFDNSDKYTVIVSTDKDMDTIPGWHYNWVQDRLYYQSLNQANLFFFWQMLVGDTADNIPGINRIGEKRATELINANNHDVDKVRQAVKELYQKQYGETWEQPYYEVGNLLYIRRKPEEECPLL
jgi:hypothetical protein